MAKDKLVIGLAVSLTDRQRKRLHKAIHKTIASQIKRAETANNKRKQPKRATRSATATVKKKTANLEVTFRNTEPGLSELTAILNSEEQTITESGTITFPNVQSGDIIIIQGTSLGSTTVTIDISAEPIQFNFEPGNFNGNFFID
ncbi:MAG TPA: hypothetical protein VNA26_03925 [Chitinophagaceae bacterium]|nr:hypothetical protein [Chitinophagaceae bacterium]